MRGRKPKPPHVKTLQPGKLVDRAGGPQAPDKPADLHPIASAEWDRVVPLLLESNVVRRLDLSVLIDYCSWFAVREVCRQTVIAEGQFTEDRFGQKREHPAISEWAKATAALKPLVEHLGLSPASRARLEVPAAPNAEIDDFDSFVGE